MLGSRQAARQQVLVLPFEGSNPSSPATFLKLKKVEGPAKLKDFILSFSIGGSFSGIERHEVTGWRAFTVRR